MARFQCVQRTQPEGNEGGCDQEPQTQAAGSDQLSERVARGCLLIGLQAQRRSHQFAWARLRCASYKIGGHAVLDARGSRSRSMSGNSRSLHGGRDRSTALRSGPTASGAGLIQVRSRIAKLNRCGQLLWRTVEQVGRDSWSAPALRSVVRHRTADKTRPWLGDGNNLFPSCMTGEIIVRILQAGRTVIGRIRRLVNKAHLHGRKATCAGRKDHLAGYKTQGQVRAADQQAKAASQFRAARCQQSA